jgi:hypothetical protein
MESLADAPQFDDTVDLDIFDDPSSDTVCDRRLSRAARSLLRKHLLRAQHKHGHNGVSPLDSHSHSHSHSHSPRYTNTYTNNNNNNNILLYNDDEETSQYIDVWSLLEDMLGKTDASKCPLIPSRDVWRHDEEHTSRIRVPSHLNFAYPAHALQQRRKASPNRLSHWFQCGYCGKVFSTQYYLDVHMQTRHPHDDVNGGVVCPANDWCRVVGLANCHEQALLEEPYYGRGSGGWGADRKFVEHKWKKVAHNSAPCDLEAIRADCRSILALRCAVALADDICAGLECPTHHRWQTFSDSMSIFVPDHWQKTWMKEARGHHHMGFVILVFLVVFGWIFHLSGIDVFKPKRKEHAGNRLLRKGPGSRRRRPSNKGSKSD